MDCSPPDSSVHRISQARILEWVAISFSRGSFWPRDWPPSLLYWQVDSLPLSYLGSPSTCYSWINEWLSESKHYFSWQIVWTLSLATCVTLNKLLKLSFLIRKTKMMMMTAAVLSLQSCSQDWRHCCCCSVAKSCHAQTRVHWLSDVTQPSHSVTPFFSCLQSFPASGYSYMQSC